MNLPRSVDISQTVCTPEEFQQSLLGRITCLTKGDSLGLVFIVLAGVLSLCAILFLFTVITKNVRPHIRNIRVHQFLFRDLIDFLMFSLLCSDIIQATGMLLNIRWIILGKVEIGRFCTAQGTIKTLGATSVALFTLAIAVYTFIGIWMATTMDSRRKALAVVVAIWAIDAFLDMLGPLVNMGEGKPSYVSISPYWCSTSKSYLAWKTLSDYVWRWITLFFCLLIYIPLYLWLRGNLFHDGRWWRPRFRRRPDHPTHGIRALVMLAYPLAYCILILPLTVVRWITWWAPQDKYHVPSSATFGTDALFGLSGFFNVVLLITTRPRLALLGLEPPINPQMGLPPEEDPSEGDLSQPSIKQSPRASRQEPPLEPPIQLASLNGRTGNQMEDDPRSARLPSGI